MTEEQKKISQDERVCFKCKKIVHKSSWNSYYEICNECVNNSMRRD